MLSLILILAFCITNNLCHITVILFRVAIILAIQARRFTLMLTMCIKLVCKKISFSSISSRDIASVLVDVDRDGGNLCMVGFNILGRISGKCMHKHHLHVDA